MGVSFVHCKAIGKVPTYYITKNNSQWKNLMMNQITSMLFCMIFALSMLIAATFGSPSPQNRDGGTVQLNGACREHHDCINAQHHCCWYMLYGQVCTSKWFGVGCIEPPLSGGSDTLDDKTLDGFGTHPLIKGVLELFL